MAGSDSNPVFVKVRCGKCKNIVDVSAQGSGACRFTCHCGQVNEFSLSGASTDEVEDVPVEFPPYWKVQSADQRTFDNESEEVKQAMQKLLDSTWKDVRTRDAKIHGRSGKMERFEVVMVQRNENPKVWGPYFKLRARLAKKLAQDGGCQTYDIKTKGEADEETNPLYERAGLMEAGNEFYLFHGTKPSAVKAICDDDFLVDMAGQNAGTLFGPGLYFAEASTKADEYADDDKEGIFSGLYAMILCRVMCGNMNYTDEVRPNVQSLVDSILTSHTHHSVLGDREKCRGTYREFIVFDRDQVYPEYVIIYKRVSED